MLISIKLQHLLLLAVHHRWKVMPTILYILPRAYTNGVGQKWIMCSFNKQKKLKNPSKGSFFRGVF